MADRDPAGSDRRRACGDGRRAARSRRSLARRGRRARARVGRPGPHGLFHAARGALSRPARARHWPRRQDRRAPASRQSLGGRRGSHREHARRAPSLRRSGDRRRLRDDHEFRHRGRRGRLSRRRVRAGSRGRRPIALRTRRPTLPRSTHPAGACDRQEHRRLHSLRDRLWIRRAGGGSARAAHRGAGTRDAARARDRRPGHDHRAARQGYRARRRRSDAGGPSPPLGAERVTRAAGRFVVLALTGSIAVYKMIELARRLVQAGATVQVVMSKGATEFVTPLTFQALTYRPVEVEMFAMQDERAAGHVAMGRQADVVVVAPATAHVLARLAHGFSDDLIATTVLATSAPVVVAPAMETHMWLNDATQANVRALRARGVRIVEPDTGPLASGEVGPGRLAAIERIASAIDDALAVSQTLAGRRIVVTAGPTIEAIDPVRFVSNRSSGKMGYAIAAAARDAGAEVTLITGPTALAAPAGVRTFPVESADDMKEAVLAQLPRADAVIMAAAIADYRPIERVTKKLKKKELGREMTVRMTENPDVLKAIVAARRPGTVVVGFKAETGDATAEASRMLRDKNLDLVVANDVADPRSGFGSDEDRVAFVSADGIEQLPLLAKSEVARRLVDKLAERLGQ